MKLRRNEIIELKKGGKEALVAKLLELKVEYAKIVNTKMHNELKNLRELSITRRAIAQLKTIAHEIKETK